MMQTSYEFDPCTLDGSEHDEDGVTLDNWKPRDKDNNLTKSQWRQVQNGCNYNQEPGLDEIKKINMYLGKKYPDHQIMDMFGIGAETLLAIKRGCYDPIDGISLDNQSKIYKEFARIQKKLDKTIDALKFIADNGFGKDDTVKRMMLKTIIGVRKSKPEEEREEDDEIY